MGSGALRLGCNWHEKNPARQGGKGCRLSLPRARRTGEARHGCRLSLPRAQWARIACGFSLPDQSAFMPRPANTAGAGGLNPLSSALAASAACEVPMGSDTSYNERRLLWKVIRFV